MAGESDIRDGNLIVQASHGELCIRASEAYLRALLEWCDGTRDLQVLTRLAQQNPKLRRFAEFLTAMLSAGVLIDRPVAILAKARRERTQMRQVAPTRSFGRLPATEEQFGSVLKALRLLGRKREPSEKGAPALRVTLLLRQAAGGLAPAIYDVPHQAYSIDSLNRIAPLSPTLYRAAADPLVLLDAVGLIVVSVRHDDLDGDLDFDQIGAILNQADSAWNAAAKALQGSGLALVDEFPCDERLLQQCCDKDDETILRIAAFGTEETAPALAARFNVRWVDDLDYQDLFIAKASLAATASLANPDVVAWGRSYDPKEAVLKAVGELCERSALTHVPAVVEARGADLPGCVAPSQLVRYAPDQYARHNLDVAPFDPNRSYHWVKGTDWRTRREHWLPADCVLLGYQPAARPLARLTSSGCAADVQLDTAIERAAYELIERDAVARHWMAQTPGRLIDGRSLPENIVERVQSLERLGCETFFLYTTLGLGPSIVVLIRHHRLGFACLGSATGSKVEAALRRAFIEAEFAAITRCHGVEGSSIRPEDCATPADHANLFAQREHYRRADALIPQKQRTTPLSEIDWPEDVCSRLDQRTPLYWVRFPCELRFPGTGNEPVNVVRVLIPGCIPLAFGYDALPRAMVPHRVPLAGRFPHPVA